MKENNMKMPQDNTRQTWCRENKCFQVEVLMTIARCDTSQHGFYMAHLDAWVDSAEKSVHGTAGW